MSNVAIIPARGGSKRIPRKNIRPFLGKPAITYVINAALQSGLFSEVVVSTDDNEIAAIAKQYGASVPFMRGVETSGEFATTAEVLNEVLIHYTQKGCLFTYACCLYPTALFVTPNFLQHAFSTLCDKRYDTIYPVQRYRIPIQEAVMLKDHKVVQWFQSEQALTRPEDLEPVYHDAGQFYFFDITVFAQTQRLITSNSGGILISEMDAHDIDTEADWQIAEFKYLLRQTHTSAEGTQPE